MDTMVEKMSPLFESVALVDFPCLVDVSPTMHREEALTGLGSY